MDPDQTAPIGAVCSESTLFASILNSTAMLGHYIAADDFSRRHFQMHFYLALYGLSDIDPVIGSMFDLSGSHTVGRLSLPECKPRLDSFYQCPGPKAYKIILNLA